MRPMRRLPDASSSRLSTRYAAKKIDEQHLGGLARLEVERAERDPEAGAVDLRADARERAAAAARPTPSSRNVYL